MQRRPGHIIPNLKHSVIDMLADEVFHEPGPGRRGTIYAENLADLYAPASADAFHKMEEYKHQCQKLTEPGTKAKLRKFVINRLGYKSSAKRAINAWRTVVWERKMQAVRPFIEPVSKGEVFRAWAEETKLLREAILLRRIWEHRPRKMYVMRRILSNMGWCETGVLLSAFKNFKLNVGFDLSESLWNAALEKEPLLKPMAERTFVQYFDCVAGQYMVKLCFSCWQKFYHGHALEAGEAPPDLHRILYNSIGVPLDAARCRMAFNAVRRGILLGEIESNKSPQKTRRLRKDVTTTVEPEEPVTSVVRLVQWGNWGSPPELLQTGIRVHGTAWSFGSEGVVVDASGHDEATLVTDIELGRTELSPTDVYNGILGLLEIMPPSKYDTETLNCHHYADALTYLLKVELPEGTTSADAPSSTKQFDDEQQRGALRAGRRKMREGQRAEAAAQREAAGEDLEPALAAAAQRENASQGMGLYLHKVRTQLF
jgi:hypothetical protein